MEGDGKEKGGRKLGGTNLRVQIASADIVNPVETQKYVCAYFVRLFDRT